jgi:hypothetical protein
LAHSIRPRLVIGSDLVIGAPFSPIGTADCGRVALLSREGCREIIGEAVQKLTASRRDGIGDCRCRRGAAHGLDEGVRLECPHQGWQGAAKFGVARRHRSQGPATVEDAAAQLARGRLVLGEDLEQLDVRYVNIGDCPDEQQLVVYPRVVALDPGGQGAAEGSSLVTQRGVLSDAEGPGEQLVAPAVGYRPSQQLIDRAAGRLGRVSNSLACMTEATLTHNGRDPRKCNLHGGRECRGRSASVRPEQAGSSAQYGNSGADGQLADAFLVTHAFSLSLVAEVGRDVSLNLVAERLHAPIGELADVQVKF